MKLILASSSRFRKELLHRLQLDFDVVSPDIDESPLAGESPLQLVDRLAREKAAAVAQKQKEAIVIGSDQVAVSGNNILGKPGSRDKAVEQLQQLSGQAVAFHTSLCVMRDNSVVDCQTVTTDVIYRNLDENEIRRYLEAEDALHSAGSLRCEALGISLCDSIRSDDPTALIGLPLITLRRMLNQAGIRVP